MPRMSMKALGMAHMVDMFKETEAWLSESEEWIVGVGAEYGVYVEVGTATQEAQPFLYPAARFVMRTRFKLHHDAARSLADLVRRVSLDIEAEAKRRAAVDTGFMRASVTAFPASAG